MSNTQSLTEFLATLNEEEIRERLDALHDEERGLRTLLRSVLARDRQKAKRDKLAKAGG